MTDLLSYHAITNKQHTTAMTLQVTNKPIKKNKTSSSTGTIEWKGDVITVTMADSVAAVTVKTKVKSEFAHKLVTAHRDGVLSTGQRFWLHKLANEVMEQEKNSVQIGGLFESLQVMLTKAGERLKSPQIRMLGPDGQELKLYPAKENSSWKGYSFIYCDGVCTGMIDTTGQFRPKKDCPVWVADTLEKFARVPIPTAQEYGRLTGRCCFCYRPLSDETSVTLGYGPICGKNYGLIF